MGSTSHTSRVVILIDMDCFYCQVEEKLNPELKGKPIAVVQYNAWRGGGIIAVNYPARDEGVTRHMRGNEAKRKCPSINLVQVPELRGKADLTKYRDAGKEVADILATFTPLLQRASVDEAYLDITEIVENRIDKSLNELSVDNLSNTYVVGSDLKDFLENVVTNKEFSIDNLKLAMGGLIAEEIRREVFLKTGYKCSAGIAHNKILAKLVCSLHKPNKQTILPQDAVPKFFETMPINKIKNLGGKFGQTLSEDFQITYMGQLANISEKNLTRKYDEKTANWLYNIARGIDMEPVTTKLISKSIACCKNFSGPSALTNLEDVERWLKKLGAEMSERLNKDLQENNRKAKQIIVSFSQEVNKKDVSSSRTHPLASYEADKIAQAAFTVIKKFCQRPDGSCHVKFLGLNASHFENVSNLRVITSFFKKGQIEDKKELQNNNSGGVNLNSEYKNCVSEENEVVDGNVYNQLTQELLTNPEELIFYDDSFRLRNNEEFSSNHINQDWIQNDNSEESIEMASSKNDNVHVQTEIINYKNDNFSIQNEAVGNKDIVNIENNLPSFFSKYFHESPKPQKSTNSSTSCENGRDYENQINLLEKHTSVEQPSEICSECQKSIPISEFVSHQDYHFAVKISKSEKNIAPQPKVNKTNNKSPAKKGKSKGVKRKIETKNTLESFLKKEEGESNPEITENCLECNKRIRIDEMDSHLDYHTAKKLHQEINRIIPLEISKVNSTKSKFANKNPAPNRSVKSFFQPA